MKVEELDQHYPLWQAQWVFRENELEERCFIESTALTRSRYMSLQDGTSRFVAARVNCAEDPARG